MVLRPSTPFHLTRRRALALSALAGGAALTPALTPGLGATRAKTTGGEVTESLEDPALDPQSAALNDLLTSSPPLHQSDLADIRAALRRTAAGLQAAGPIEVFKVEDTDVPLTKEPLPVRLYRPMPGPASTSGAPPIILYFHGGALVAGSIDTHDHVARRLCRACDALVVSVGYRLAPEAPFPAALDDAYDALEWVAEQGAALGGDPSRIALAGDDAGGMLATSAAIRTRLTPFDGVRFLVLMTPLLLLTDSTDQPSREAFGQGGFQPSLADLAWMRARYLSLEEGEIETGTISPLEASSFKGLPQTLVLSAGYDATRDDCGLFVRRLRENGVVAGERRFRTTIHDFIFYADLVPAVADGAIDVVAAQFRQAMSG